MAPGGMARKPGPARVWLEAARPRTLPVAVAPVLIGSAMAAADDRFAWAAGVVALLGALLIQVGTNLHNDYADHARGADTAGRVGPRRAAQAGLLQPAQLRRGVAVVFGAAAAAAAAAAVIGGWPILIVAAASVAAGLGYTGGRRPLGYLGLGDLLAFVFFGPVATAATYYLHAGAAPAQAIAAGIGPGLLAAAILTVNNLRDIDTDRAAGKRTLAVRLGARFARAEYLGCIVGAAAAPTALAFAAGRWAGALPLMTIVAAAPWIVIVMRPSRPVDLNHALAGTARTMLIHALLFCIGWSIT